MGHADDRGADLADDLAIVGRDAPHAELLATWRARSADASTMTDASIPGASSDGWKMDPFGDRAAADHRTLNS